jgi:hypothetical protein
MDNRGGNRIIIPPGYYTTKQVADDIGRSKDTVQRWREAGLLPYELMDTDGPTVYLFDNDALALARRLATTGGRLINRTAA